MIALTDDDCTMTGTPSPAITVPPRSPSRCTGCGRCISACPERLLTLEAVGRRKHARLTTASRCSRCGRCVDACPFVEGNKAP